MDDPEFVVPEELIGEMRSILELLASTIEAAKCKADELVESQWPVTRDGFTYSHIMRANILEYLESSLIDFEAKLKPVANTGIYVVADHYSVRVLHSADPDEDYKPQTARRMGYALSSGSSEPDQLQLDLMSAGMHSLVMSSSRSLDLEPEKISYAAQCQADSRVHTILHWAYIGGEQKITLLIPKPVSDFSEKIEWWKMDVNEYLDGHLEFTSVAYDADNEFGFFKDDAVAAVDREIGSNEWGEAQNS